MFEPHTHEMIVCIQRLQQGRGGNSLNGGLETKANIILYFSTFKYWLYKKLVRQNYE